MNLRIALWAVAGFGVACLWVVSGIALGRGQNPGTMIFAAITAPASLVGRSIPLAYHWFVLLNAAIYALVGLAAELACHAFYSLRPKRGSLSAKRP